MTCEYQSGRAKGQGRREVWFPMKREMVNEYDCSQNFFCIARNMCAHVFFPAVSLLSIHFSLCTQVLRQTSRYRWRNLPSSIFLGSGSLFYWRKAWFRKKKLNCSGVYPAYLNWVHLSLVCVVCELSLPLEGLKCLLNKLCLKLQVFDDINLVWVEEPLKAKAYNNKWSFGAKLEILFSGLSVKVSQNSRQPVFRWYKGIFVYLSFLQIASKYVR